MSIVTNGGGLGILFADACASAGLDVVALSQAEVEGLRDRLPPEPRWATRSTYLAADHRPSPRRWRLFGASGEVDTIIAVYVPQWSSGRPRWRSDAAPARRPSTYGRLGAVRDSTNPRARR